MPDFYCLNVDSRRVCLILGVNDVPIMTDRAGEGLRAVRAINEWILPRGNRLTAYLEWPDAQPFTPGTAQVRAQLFLADPRSDFPRPGQVLAEFRWPPADGAETYPHRFEHAFDAPRAIRTLLWQEAEVVPQITASDRNELLAQLGQLRDRLAARDVPGVLAQLRYRFDDDARANGIDPQVLRQSVAEQYELLLNAPQPQITIPDPSAATFEVLAGQRIVRASGPAPEALVITGDHLRFRAEVYFAKIRGHWGIVR